MSKLYRVRELGGIVKDRPGSLLRPGEWTDGSNVQFQDGHIHKSGGYATAFNFSPVQAPVHMAFWSNADGTGDESNQYAYFSQEYMATIRNRSTSAGPAESSQVWNGQTTGGALTSITETGGVATATRTAHGYSNNDVVEITGASPDGYNGFWRISNVTANTFDYTVVSTLANASPAGNVDLVNELDDSDLDYGWSTAQIGDFLVANPSYRSSTPTEVPQVVGSSFGTSLTNWPASTFTRCVRSWDNRLWALWERESGGTYYPYRVRWSQISVDGALPASWDETDVTTGAGYIDLTAHGGLVLDALPMGDRLMVYRESAIHEFYPVGDTFIYGQRLLFDGPGILALNCVVEHKGIHYVFGNHDIYAHDGHRVRSIAEGRIRDYIFNDATDGVDTDYYQRSFVFVDREREEVWFCYVPSSGGTTCRIAWIYDINNDQWGRRALPGILGMAQGYPAFAATETNTVKKKSIVWGDFGDSLLQLVDSGNQAAGVNMTASLTRDELQIWSPHQTGRILKIFPIIESTGTPEFTFTVGGRNSYGGALSTVTRTYTHGTDYKIPIDQTVRIPYISLQTTTDVDWRLHGYDIEYEIVGER